MDFLTIDFTNVRISRAQKDLILETFDLEGELDQSHISSLEALPCHSITNPHQSISPLAF